VLDGVRLGRRMTTVNVTSIHRIKMNGASMLIRVVILVTLISCFSCILIADVRAETATGIGAGGAHTCAITSTGLMCWGFNERGALGDGTVAGKTMPVTVIGINEPVAQVEGGGAHTCLLLTNGGVKCWGLNGNGELGDGTTTPNSGPTPYSKPSPVDVFGLSSGVEQISVGNQHTCALLASGNLKCWGYSSAGAIGDGTNEPVRSAPVDVIGLGDTVDGVSAGVDFTCALLSGGGVKCWGITNDGRLGNGSNTSQPGSECINCQTTPVDVVGLDSGVLAVTTGGESSCALLDTGSVKCWGSNRFGQLGDGTTTDRYTPVDVVGLDDDVLEISAGGGHTCALVADKSVMCWGNNYFGTLGDNTTTETEPFGKPTPVTVLDLSTPVSHIAVGSSHSCALMENGSIKSWGDN
jgi:alpha-tubulin suppressor-like RCC1 family protein